MTTPNPTITIHQIDCLANYFGGAFTKFVESDRKDIPPMLRALTYCILYKKPMTKPILDYAETNNVWHGMLYTVNGILDACRHGRLGFIRWMFRKSNRVGDTNLSARMLKTAIIYDQVEVIDWILNNMAVANRRDMFGLAMCTSLTVAQYLYEQRGVPIKSENLHEAYGYGSIELIKWLHTKINLFNPSAAFEYTCIGDNVRNARYLLTRYAVDLNQPQYFEQAVSANSEKMTKFLYDYYRETSGYNPVKDRVSVYEDILDTAPEGESQLIWDLVEDLAVQ